MFLRLVVFRIRDLLNINPNSMHVRSKVPSDIKQGLQRFQNMMKGKLAHLLLVLTKIYDFGPNLPVQPLAGNVVVQLCATNLRGIRPKSLLFFSNFEHFSSRWHETECFSTTSQESILSFNSMTSQVILITHNENQFFCYIISSNPWSSHSY